jgi:squalene-hopene/tetraprenyl-beta-curcumene cyclase
MIVDDNPLDTIRAAQNPDGGWPYRKGASWTEPTAYALLACAAGRAAPLSERALAWLRAAQRPDGGWPPCPSVAQSTWVTALVALLPPEAIGASSHARAVAWLLRQSGMESTPAFRLREFLRSGRLPEHPEKSGWPWFPGTAAWVTPTCLAILALRRWYWRQPSAAVRERIEKARNYLLARRCADGGWNHGSASALGYACFSYPETTGQALLALAGADPGPLQDSFALARRFLWERRPPAGAAWLRLGLLAHRQLEAGSPFLAMPCRTLPDAALLCLARQAERGSGLFLS